MKPLHIVGAIAGGAVGLLGLVGVFGSFYTVDQGERGVVLEFGAAKKVTGAGLHWKTPFVESVRKISMRVSCISWDEMSAYSKDQQPATMSVKVCYQADPETTKVLSLYENYKTAKGYSRAVIQPSTLEAVKSVFGQFNAVRAIQERGQLNTDVETRISNNANAEMMIVSVDIQNIVFSEAYERSVEERMQEQVLVEKAAQTEEREKIAANIKVIQAEAEATRVRLAGEAEAAAINARGEALRNNPELVTLVAAEKWDGKLPTTQVPGSALPFLQIPNQ
jgi:regulator of protease activity HflC (stomatin/prohibitin superfamily)